MSVLLKKNIMSNPYVMGIVYFVHVMATVLWVGGTFVNLFVFLPSAKDTLEPPVMGKFMGDVMKRFKPVVYTCMVLLGITGFIMMIQNANYSGLMKFENTWNVFSFIKHITVVLWVIIGIYIFEGLLPKMGKLAAQGPSPELGKLQALQMKLGMVVVVLAIVVLYLTGVMNSISSLN